MTKQATPHARLTMVSTLRWRLNRNACPASVNMLRSRISNHYLSYRSASTGVSDAARQAGQNEDAIATRDSAPNAQAVVIPLTGRPPNISGIGNELTILARPHENPQPSAPLIMASR